jgi:hypothetical protein
MTPLLRSAASLWVPLVMTQFFAFAVARAHGGLAFTPVLLLMAACLGRVEGACFARAGHKRSDVPLGWLAWPGALVGAAFALWTEDALLVWARARYTYPGHPSFVQWLLYDGVIQSAVYWLPVGLAQFVALRHLGPRAPLWIPATVITGLAASVGFAVWTRQSGRNTYFVVPAALLIFTGAALLRAATIERLFPPPAGALDRQPVGDAA